MKRRRHLWSRLYRLDPPAVGGGVLFFEDLESGAVKLEDLPPVRPGCGYLLVNRPCTKEEWIERYGGPHNDVGQTEP